MRARLALLAAFLPLAGCIPPSATNSGGSERVERAPRLETDLDTLFEEQPVWDARPAGQNTEIVAEQEYVVQEGETLSGIAEKTGAGAGAIAQANYLAAPFALRTGQTLAIPGGPYHRVTAGETGIAIARAHGVKWAEIIALNGLSEPYILRVSQRLRLPDANSVESRAAAFRLNIDDILTGGEPATASVAETALPETNPTRPLSPSIPVREPSNFSGTFAWPARGTILKSFGPAGEGKHSDGIDIALPAGTSFRAASDGVIAFVGDGVAGYGGVILIRHGGGWISAYGNAASAQVTRGQSVKKGQLLGNVGSGEAPQLHFELRKNRVPVDPVKQLPAG